jgi:hypothetical protein
MRIGNPEFELGLSFTDRTPWPGNRLHTKDSAVILDPEKHMLVYAETHDS